MTFITITSRIVLICTALFGIFKFVEMMKPESNNQYYIGFIVIFIAAFFSLFNWEPVVIGKGK